MSPELKAAIAAARFHAEKGIDDRRDGFLIEAADEIDRLQAELDRRSPANIASYERHGTRHFVCFPNDPGGPG